ncbi:MAG: glutathione peroxidase [Alphaproteobacteria bacterium]
MYKKIARSLKNFLGVFLSFFYLQAAMPAKAQQAITTDLYSIGFNSIEGKAMSFADFKGKVILVVNTASRCGFTPQYEGLEKLWQLYKDKGLVVLGVPSDDFDQELENNAEIVKFCKLRYGIDFPLTEKTAVKGDNAHPFFQWVKAQGQSLPSWNFNKYLINKQGKLVEKYSSMTTPDGKEIIAHIEKLLAE